MFATWKCLHCFDQEIWDSESVCEYDCNGAEEVGEEISVNVGTP